MLHQRYQYKSIPAVTNTCGVSQRSVLGPLFFLVHINDLQHAVGDCGVIKLYAYDSVLYHSGVTCNEANQTSNQSKQMLRIV